MPTTRSKKRRLNDSAYDQHTSLPTATSPSENTKDSHAKENPSAYIHRVLDMFEPSSSTLKTTKQPSPLEIRLAYIHRAFSMFTPGPSTHFSAYANTLDQPDDHLSKVRQDLYSIVHGFVSQVISDDKLFASFQELLPEAILELDEVRRQAIQDFDNYDSGHLSAQICAENFNNYISKIDNELRDNSMTSNANLAMGVEILMLEGVVQRGLDSKTSDLYDLLIAQRLSGVPFVYNIVVETPPAVFKNYAGQVDRIVKVQSHLAGQDGNWRKLQKLLATRIQAARQMQ